MKLSDKRQAEIYNTISEPITKLRIHLNKYGVMDYKDLDLELFNMQHDIWIRLHKALKLEGPA